MAGYEIDEPAIKALLQQVAGMLKRIMPPGWGFTLFLMSYGENGATFYLSTIERDTSIAALKEWIAKVEAEAAREVH